jgi:hypothetical protein
MNRLHTMAKWFVSSDAGAGFSTVADVLACWAFTSKLSVHQEGPGPANVDPVLAPRLVNFCITKR